MFREFLPFQGPSRFEFKDPDTGHMYRADSYGSLYQLIRGYRSQNELPEIPFLETVVEHYICMLPEHRGLCRRKRHRLKRGLIPTIRGGVSVITSLMYNSFAPQEVADARSEVCKGCKYNVFPDKGKFVEWSDDLALMTIGERKSKFHDDLGTCDVCQCPMRSKVWINQEFTLTEPQVATMKEVGCWQPEVAKIRKGK